MKRFKVSTTQLFIVRLAILSKVADRIAFFQELAELIKAKKAAQQTVANAAAKAAKK